MDTVNAFLALGCIAVAIFISKLDKHYIITKLLGAFIIPIAIIIMFYRIANTQPCYYYQLQDNIVVIVNVDNKVVCQIDYIEQDSPVKEFVRMSIDTQIGQHSIDDMITKYNNLLNTSY